jgi:hypothetical protein
MSQINHRASIALFPLIPLLRPPACQAFAQTALLDEALFQFMRARRACQSR